MRKEWTIRSQSRRRKATQDEFGRSGESLIWEYPRESVLATVIFAEDGGTRSRGGLDRPDLLPAAITAHLDRHESGKRSIALGLHHDLLDQ